MEAKETFYGGCWFRSRIEARWAMCFDILEIEWVYELRHYDFGEKHVWDDYEFKEYLQEALSDSWDEDEDEVIREAYRKRYERRMYLPDFWLPELEHWVEIKGKSPNYEEQIKARKLAIRTGKPVTVLWGYIPDPKEEDWAKCAEVYQGNMNIIALIVLECGVNAVKRAFTSARQARFDHKITY